MHHTDNEIRPKTRQHFNLERRHRKRSYSKRRVAVREADTFSTTRLYSCGQGRHWQWASFTVQHCYAFFQASPNSLMENAPSRQSFQGSCRCACRVEFRQENFMSLASPPTIRSRGRYQHLLEVEAVDSLPRCYLPITSNKRSRLIYLCFFMGNNLISRI